MPKLSPSPTQPSLHPQALAAYVDKELHALEESPGVGFGLGVVGDLVAEGLGRY